MIYGLLTVLFFFTSAQAQIFSFHMPSEPASLDIAGHRGSGGSSYLFNNLVRTLYKYDLDLKPDLAQTCQFLSSKKLRCTLREAFWSDGSAITAMNFVTSFRHLIDPKLASDRADLLKNIKNAPDILKGQKKIEELGVRALNSKTFEIEFYTPDSEFLYKTVSPVLGPIKNLPLPSLKKASELIVSGPYQIEKWEKGRKIVLKPNPFFSLSTKTKNLRPPIEIFFISEDSVALNLFESGKLQFLRRLPALHIPRFKNKPEFLQLPVSRLDYIGFANQLHKNLELRQALSMGVNFDEFQQLFFALGRPGCPGIPESWMDTVPCQHFDMKRAQEALKSFLRQRNPPRLKMAFSLLGGDDPRRAVEWFQNQWRSNLNLDIELKGLENKSYVSILEKNPPDIFRRGVGLGRPTCLAALETFDEQNPENFIQLKSPKYQKILKEMASSFSSQEKKKLCSKGIEFLIKNSNLILLGREYFTLLIKPQFKGWKLNEMNFLDLSELTYQPERN